MGADDCTTDRQPESCTADRALVVTSLEFVEQPLAPQRRQARTLVLDRERNASCRDGECDADKPFLRAVANGVLEQVADEARKLVAVAAHLESRVVRFAGHRKPGPASRHLRLALLDRVLDHGAQRNAAQRAALHERAGWFRRARAPRWPPYSRRPPGSE